MTETVDYGGTERALEHLILRLDPASTEAVILCFGRDYFTQALHERHSLHLSIVNGLKANGFASFWNEIRRFAPQSVMFVNGYQGVFPWYAYLAARVAGAKRIVGIEQLLAEPLPVREHTSVLRKLAFPLTWRARHIFKNRLQGVLSDWTICVSEAVRRRLVDMYRFPAHKTVTIWNGVDLARFNDQGLPNKSVREQMGVKEGDPLICCVARLHRIKGIDVLLESMSRLLPVFSTCKCVIVGDGPHREEFVAQAKRRSLQDAVIFVGHQDDVLPYLRASDLFVLPSHKEGLPLALVEAMACGLPAVVTDAGGNSEAVIDGYNGLVVEPGSAEQLSRALQTLLSNERLRAEMSANARVKAGEFDLDRLMSRVKDLLI